MATIDKIFDNHKAVLEGDDVALRTEPRYKRYAVTNLRGGVGKTSIAFNLAYELTRTSSMLIVDVCPQCNLTETFFRDDKPEVTIINAIEPQVVGPAFGEAPDEIAYRISDLCHSFKGGKKSFLLAGSPELFSFPSMLYGQLQLAFSRGGTSARAAVQKLLHSLRDVVNKAASELGLERVLFDTSPFYAGGTHLAWCAAEALIVPVRVDEHSIESLRLTLDMLANPAKDFRQWNERAGIASGPKIAAIVMTMVGAKSQVKSLPDRASRMFIERALSLASEYPQLFDVDPADAFVISDDFMSTGRISGAKSIPISKLETKQFHTIDAKRLQVNASVTRYQRELHYLASII